MVGTQEKDRLQVSELPKALLKDAFLPLLSPSTQVNFKEIFEVYKPVPWRQQLSFAYL